MVSALQENGLAEAWGEMTSLVEWRREAGHFTGRRAAQAQYWFEQEVREGLLAELQNPEMRAEMTRIGADVAGGHITPTQAARDILSRLRHRP